MGLFVCSECGCVENTNCATEGINNDPTFPNLHTMEMHGFDDAYEASAVEFDNRIRSPERMLCSKCNTGTWHGKWEQSWPTDVELAMANDMDGEGRVFTSHPLFKGSYNNEMDSYTLEQFEEDNKKRKDDEEKEVERRKFMSLKSDEFYDQALWPRPEPFVRDEPKIGRNDLCPCGSGKKYKKCCQGK